ncbi:carbohydrate kinase family protein [Candidatus Woesearchaeota archaeon]|nr:MAG: carbohydrate kinase family protein [Candidatus Woesearchaeota archaeon ex4484_78]RLE46855.1 MAG: carbohydrate kinase family protein [Candidatus Woesearchaeota archaeon]
MFDIITVGSAAIDVFIKTKSSDVEVEKVNKHEDICMPLGAKILIDELVTDTGGGGTNTAVSFSRLGFKTGWLGIIGNDLNSKLILDQIKKEKVSFLGKHAKGGSGFSVILTGWKENRTILTFKGINNNLKIKDIDFKKLRTKWFYFASMMGESWNSLKKIARFALEKKIPVAFNPSLYLAEKGKKELLPVLKAVKILVLNKEEAQALTKKSKINDLLKDLQKTVPITVITDGDKGAFAYDGKIKYVLQIPDIVPVETTGAGDSFASAFVASIIKKQSISRALKNGFVQARSVLSAFGAKNKLLSWKELSSKKSKTRVIETFL